MKRLAFLGAMNRDLVADIAGDIVLQRLGLAAPALIETAVSDDVAASGAAILAGMNAADYLGGSAFNAARVAGLLNAKDRMLDLAFFGIAGVIDGRAPHLAALADWRIASEHVQQSALPPATCLAMVEKSGRTLLTASGANAGIADYLRDEHGTLARILAGQHIVHITSFLDPASPGLIADLLAEARAINPGLMVSLDPGAAWIIPGGEGFERLLRHADILHLNAEELAHLGGAPADITPRLHSEDALIVARTHIDVTIRQGQSSRALPSVALPAHVIDSTGAGDTFCGAFLWHLATGADPLDAASRGFTLARAKITQNGPITAETLSA